jgi:hypothetical protein
MSEDDLDKNLKRLEQARAELLRQISASEAVLKAFEADLEKLNEEAELPQPDEKEPS